MKARYFILFLTLISVTLETNGQEINFGQFGNFTLTVGELNSNGLDFGQVVSEGGIFTIDINNSKIITITGVRFLDVIVEVNAENSLFLNGNPGNAGDPQKSIPFTLEAAFANNKGTPTIGQAKFINVTNNTIMTQFPILERQNRPPGPPPRPFTKGFDQSKFEETAYLFLFGSINVGSVDAGFYSSEITITVNYD